MFRALNNYKSGLRIKFLQNGRKYSSSLPSQADVVIIGGGIAGCSTLYQLSKRGVKALLLERAKFTSGTTWHTAGLVWSLRPHDVEIQLLAESRRVYSGLEKETGQPSGWINNGGLFISQSKVRTDEYCRLATFGKAFGIEGEILDPQETAKRYPLLEASAIHTALLSKSDGVVDPAMACAGLIKAATKSGTGCQAFEQMPVLQIQTGSNILGNLEVKGVVTAQGVINTKCVINCAGAWGGKIAKYGGLKGLPLLPMKHAYVVSESIPGVRGMPNVRDHDGAFYFRIQGDSICMGGYEGNPFLLEKGVPDNFEFQLYELDWSVFSSHIDGASKLCPTFGKYGIKSTVCGPESFTPDHKPLMGEDPQLFGLYHNCGYNSAGMMFSPGCAKQMAEWVISGRPELPMFYFDIRRFSPTQLANEKWLKERSHEAYARNYDVVCPNDEHLGGRNLQLAPLHEQLVNVGAVMQSRAGWERPAFYVKNEVIRVPEYDWGGYYGHKKNTDIRYDHMLKGDQTFGFSKHHNRIGEEALQCRNDAALFDISYYGKFYLTGPDAQAAANLIFTSNLEHNQNDKIVYTCVLNDAGGVEADLTVSILENGTGKLHEPIFKGRGYYIVASGFSAYQTLNHMKKVINSRGLKANVTDVTTQIGILSLQGPNSQIILQKLTDSGLSNDAFPAGTHKSISVGGVGPCRALRVGWAGELGWELHIPTAHILPIYEALVKVGGWKHAGWRALTSLSAEKGYHLWNADIRLDDNPVEAGLGFTCRKEGYYIGKEHVDRIRNEGCMKKYAYFTLEEKQPLFGMETVYRNGEICGFLRRGDYAYYLDKSIGIAYIRHQEKNTPVTADYLKEGDYEIELFGKKYKANLHLKSPFDPKNLRISGNYEDPKTRSQDEQSGQNERSGGCE